MCAIVPLMPRTQPDTGQTFSVTFAEWTMPKWKIPLGWEDQDSFYKRKKSLKTGQCIGSGKEKRDQPKWKEKNKQMFGAKHFPRAVNTVSWRWDSHVTLAAPRSLTFPDRCHWPVSYNYYPSVGWLLPFSLFFNWWCVYNHQLHFRNRKWRLPLNRP